MSVRFAEISSALGRGLGFMPRGHARRFHDRASRPVPSVVDEPAPVVLEMTCTRTDTSTGCVLEIAGALDVHTAPEIRAVFDAVVAARKEVVTVDLSRLTMIDSSGVGAIVSLFKRVKAAGGTLVVRGLQNQPLAVFKLLRLERVFGM